MARADGTYYFPDSNGMEVRISSNVARRIDWTLLLEGGSGTVKATFEGRLPNGDWKDITTDRIPCDHSDSVFATTPNL